MNLIAQEPAPEPSYRFIPLTQGQFAIVDAADYQWLMQWHWTAKWSKFTRSFYAVRGCHVNGKPREIKMHRQILGLEHGDKRQTDHKETGNTLDNRRSNLRIATRSQNCSNSRRRRKNPYGFKGIHFKKSIGRWVAKIQANKKQFHLGCYQTPEAAYEAYCAAARKLHGEFAHLG